MESGPSAHLVHAKQRTPVFMLSDYPTLLVLFSQQKETRQTLAKQIQSDQVAKMVKNQ